MDKDRIAGTAKDVAGKVEGGIGDITGDKETEASGRMREASGVVQNLYGQAKDSAAEAAHVVRQGAADAGDYVRHMIEERPYTATVVALCIGFMIGRLGRRDY